MQIRIVFRVDRVRIYTDDCFNKVITNLGAETTPILSMAIGSSRFPVLLYCVVLVGADPGHWALYPTRHAILILEQTTSQNLFTYIVLNITLLNIGN